MTTRTVDRMVETSTERTVRTERLRVRGEQLLAKVRELVHEGNTRRIVILNEEGRALVELPLTLGVVGAMLVPVWVAVGAMAALAADYTLLVERTERAEPPGRAGERPST